jgi:hypothetical protein
MENSQSVQRKPTQSINTTLELTDSQSGAGDSTHILIHLLIRNPWVLLVGLLTMFLGSGAFALYSLGYVGYTKPQSSEPEDIPEAPPVVVQTPNTPSDMSNPIPLWMVIAIALSCGSGCWVIMRLIQQPTERQKTQKTIKRHSVPVVASQKRQHQPQPAKNVQVFVPTSSLTPIRKPLMTVLPLEHTHRLNQAQESLVELLDLRKQSSLSTILRKY